jgi:purine-binding chemotaxis protein CheW
MPSTLTKIDERLQKAGKTESEYLTFTFFERAEDGRPELRAVGWAKLTAREGRAKYIKGVVELWGQEIDIIDLRAKAGIGSTELTKRSCLVVFEYSDHYLGMVVEDISSIINIAGKNAVEAVMRELEI